MQRSVLMCVLLAGCGSQERAESTSEVVGEPEVEAPAPPPEAEVTAYEIHEWGVIDVDLSTQRVELAAGPGRLPAPSRPQPPPFQGHGGAPRKPVLYFHLRDANPSFRFDLTVNLGAMRVVEHWPSGELSENGVRWEDVALSAEHCAGGPYPSVGDVACQNIADGYCEARELENYVTDDSGCLTVGGREQSLLFYRGDGPSPPLPLTIERDTSGTVRVTNLSMRESAGTILRLRRAGAAIYVLMSPLPAQGASVVLATPSAPATDAHRGSIRDQLRALGMTESESAAFERAWFGELFDGAAPTPHAFADAVFFFLPEGGADAFARLEASPAPASVHRAMAVRAGWP